MKAEDISVHMHNEKTETKQLKDKVKITTGTVHAGEIKKTTRLTLSTEKQWKQAISEDHDLGYIKSILSSTQETTIDPKQFRNKGYVKPFQQGNMELDNGLNPIMTSLTKPGLDN